MNKSYWVYLLSVILAATIAITERIGERSALPLFSDGFSDDAILVNEGAIKRVDYLTAVTMMEEEKRLAMRAVDYQLIVDRLTEEELLFQYGLEQGFIYHPEISRIIVSNMLETIAVQHTSENYSDEKLYQIYRDKIVQNADIEQLSGDLAFNNIKQQLASALREIERSKAVRQYLGWLRKRSEISSANLDVGGVKS